MQSGRHLVSLGGWCGPALILGKLGMRSVAYPFDFSRVTFDGVIHFIENGFQRGFFPPGPPPYRPECVGIWVLFRGQHTAFAHFDLNDPKILDAFSRKITRFEHMLDGREGPVTFFRTVTARDPAAELQLVPKLNEAVRRRNPQLDFRTVMVVHDQGLSRTAELAPIDAHTRLFALEYTEDSSRTLFDRTQAGYAEIVARALDDDGWARHEEHALRNRGGCDEPLLWREREAGSAGVVAADTKQPVTDAEYSAATDDGMDPRREPGTVVMPELLHKNSFPWRMHNNLALIEGIASVGGTCVGIGSTLAGGCEHGEMSCPYCGSTNFHKAHRPFRTDRPFTDEEDELLLIHLYKILCGGDKVEAVEQLAHEMNRGAFEIICRIQFLTNSSTKITDGLDLEDA